MNAYELADKLQMEKARALLYVDSVVESASMLRQQADRIAELEIILKQEGISVGRDLLNGGIAVLKKNKELSDEEIYNLWCDADNTECMPEMRNKDGSINQIITTFAELIIKASRGEE